MSVHMNCYLLCVRECKALSPGTVFIRIKCTRWHKHFSDRQQTKCFKLQTEMNTLAYQVQREKKKRNEILNDQAHQAFL